MLLLSFRLGNERFAIDTAHVTEVIPIVECKRVPGVPREVVGVFNYHGDFVPLLDLAALATGKDATDGKRIVIVGYPVGGSVKPLGLLLGNEIDLMRRADEDFVEPPIQSDATYAGRIAPDDGGMVQRIELSSLVPEDLWDRLGIAQGSAS